MRMLCLAKYPWTGPSSRYRVYQFQPYLRTAGIEIDVQSLHDDDYLGARYAGRRPGAGYQAARVAARLLALCRAKHYHLVFIQKELFPHVPGVAEALLERMGVKMVLDIDDAIHLPYRGTRLERKVPRVIARCALVLAGNRYLAEYARRFNPNVVLFPTVVDAARFAPRRDRDGGDGARRPVVGWIGSPATSAYLRERLPALEGIARKTDFTLFVVGEEGVTSDSLEVRAKPWREDEEVDDLRAMDVGIMPLSDDEWSDGKCALKLLQYMSTGVASVATPRGGARDIISDGDNGFFATTDAEWGARVHALLADAALRRRVGERAREWVEAHYSLDRYGPLLARHLLDAAGVRGGVR